MAKRRTIEEQRQLYDQIEKNISEGATVRDTLKKAGISDGCFYKWRRHFGKALPESEHRPTVKPELLTLHYDEETQPLIVLMGKPKDINVALERLARIHGGR